jgi:hypothetical protein
MSMIRKFIRRRRIHHPYINHLFNHSCLKVGNRRFTNRISLKSTKSCSRKLIYHEGTNLIHSGASNCLRANRNDQYHSQPGQKIYCPNMYNSPQARHKNCCEKHPHLRKSNRLKFRPNKAPGRLIGVITTGFELAQISYIRKRT